MPEKQLKKPRSRKSSEWLMDLKEIVKASWGMRIVSESGIIQARYKFKFLTNYTVKATDMSSNRSRGQQQYNGSEFREDFLRSLPPGTEDNSSLHGHFRLTIGDLCWLKTSFPPENTKLRLKFWGQTGIGRVVVAKNATPELMSLYGNGLEYEIRCPALLFGKYLEDMVRLKVDVLDKRNDKVVGNIIVNMLLFLKGTRTAAAAQNNSSPLEDIKGLFPIYKHQTNCNKPEAVEKIGEIELEMNVRFLKFPLLQPQALKSSRSNDQARLHLDSSFMLNEIKTQHRVGDLAEEILLRNQAQNNLLHAQQQNSPQSILTPKGGQRNNRNIDVQNLLLKQQFDQLQTINSPTEGEIKRGVQSRRSSPHEPGIRFADEQVPEGRNERIQRILNEEQEEQYIRLAEKQKKRALDMSSAFLSLPVVSPELELLKLRMDEAELISDLPANIYSDLTSLPENLPQKENFDLQNVSGYAIQVDTFNLTNSLFKKKLSKTQVFLTIQLPIIESTAAGDTRVLYDQLFVTCRKQPNLNSPEWNPISTTPIKYEFNQSFPSKLQLNEQSVTAFTEARLHFIIFIGGEEASSRVEFARGEFKFDMLLLKPYLRGQFMIPLYPTQTFAGGDAKGKNEKKALKNGQKEVVELKLAGELSVSVALLNMLSQFIPHSQEKKDKENEEKENKRSENLKRNRVQNLTADMMFQMVVDVRQIREFSRPLTGAESMVIRHKVYSKNESLEGISEYIQVKSNEAVFAYKAVMPVDSSGFARMPTIPFVLEVWRRSKLSVASAPTEELVGMVRINLKCLPELVQNPHAFAQNIYPTTLIDGDIPVWDPSSNKNVATACIHFAFGTVQQVHHYEKKQVQKQDIQSSLQVAAKKQTSMILIEQQGGSKKEIKKPSLATIEQQQRNAENTVNEHSISDSAFDKDDHSNRSQLSFGSAASRSSAPRKFRRIRFDQMSYSKEQINKVFVVVMENIRRNKRRAANILRTFIVKAEKNERRVTLMEFYRFLDEIPVQEALRVRNGYLHKLISVMDFEDCGEISTVDFVKSYNSYLNYEDILRDLYSASVKQLAICISAKSIAISDLERVLIRWSEFGFVKREDVKRILEEELGCDKALTMHLLELVDTQDDGLIQCGLLPDYLRGVEVYGGLGYVQVESNRYSELVKANLQENLVKNEEGVRELLLNDELADRVIHVRDIQYLVEGLGLEISFWESLCVIEAVRKQMNVPISTTVDEFSIPFIYFSDWLAFIIKQYREDPGHFNHFSYLVEQRAKLQEEQLIYNGGANVRQVSNNSNNSNRQDKVIKNLSNQHQRPGEYQGEVVEDEENQEGGRGEDEDEDDLIMLVNNNYRR